MRECRECGHLKPLSAYYHHKKSGPSAWCKPCENRRAQARRYGLSVLEIEEMHERQGDRCAVCGVDATSKKNAHHKYAGLFVDHCHSTGRVRGLLCHQCNVGLGNFRDDPALLAKAAAYLCEAVVN